MGFALAFGGVVATLAAYGGRWADPDAPSGLRMTGPAELIVGLVLLAVGLATV
ncbi:hypothetical protein [uncultured Jatrophihabitans sp.]|uniref:hypothetical protein n=1 Tax=uncultured Jatrophihabitans sp. TaxID=1610747 RepID=UPI0035CA8C9C